MCWEFSDVFSRMGSYNYVIVTFVDEEDTPGIVSSNWMIDSTTCYYPNVCTEEMKNKLLIRMAEPKITWPRYHINISKGYETYDEACLHLKKAKESSNLDSNEEVIKRKRNWEINVYSSDESSDNSPPLKIKAPKKKSKRKNDYSKYPAHLIPKLTENTLAEESSDNEVEIYTVYEIKPNITEQSHNPMEVHTSNCHSNGGISSPPAAVDDPLVIATSRSNQGTELDEFNTDVNIGCKEANNEANKVHSSKAMECQSGCFTTKHFSEQQSHLIQVVSNLTNQVAELNRKVDLLLVRSAETFTTQTENNEICELMATLPAKDEASFDHFNEQLKINQNKQAIMSYLAGIGGRNVRSTTTNILRRILLDDVAELYSLTGKQMKTSNKKSFLSTETCKLIFQICRKLYRNVTEDDLRDVVSDWLNQAKVRISRRLERQNKK